MICVTEMECVYCAVRTGSLNTIEFFLKFIRTQANIFLTAMNMNIFVFLDV